MITIEVWVGQISTGLTSPAALVTPRILAQKQSGEIASRVVQPRLTQTIAIAAWLTKKFPQNFKRNFKGKMTSRPPAAVSRPVGARPGATAALNNITGAIIEFYSTGKSLYLEEAGLMDLVNDRFETIHPRDEVDDETPRLIKKRRAKNIFNYNDGKALLYEYYMSRKVTFRKVFRMDLDAFEQLLNLINNFTDVFSRKKDGLGNEGVHCEIKILACLNVITSGKSMVQVADRFKFGRETLNYYFDKFIELMPKVLDEFIKFPDDIAARKLVKKHLRKHKLPGMIGSLDCLHWFWGQCRLEEAYGNTGKSGKPSMVLEAVCDMDLRLMFFNFGMPGCQNDITIIRNSPLLKKVSNNLWRII